MGDIKQLECDLVRSRSQRYQDESLHRTPMNAYARHDLHSFELTVDMISTYHKGNELRCSWQHPRRCQDNCNHLPEVMGYHTSVAAPFYSSHRCSMLPIVTKHHQLQEKQGLPINPKFGMRHHAGLRSMRLYRLIVPV